MCVCEHGCTHGCKQEVSDVCEGRVGVLGVGCCQWEQWGWVCQITESPWPPPTSLLITLPFSPPPQVVLHRLWSINPALLMEALVEYYAQVRARLCVCVEGGKGNG